MCVFSRASASSVRVTSHINMNESCHTFELDIFAAHRVFPRICLLQMSFVTSINESCHTCDCGTNATQCFPARLPPEDESRHAYRRVMSHILMSHAPHVRQSRDTCDVCVFPRFCPLLTSYVDRRVMSPVMGHV